jgi:hypothetical protein
MAIPLPPGAIPNRSIQTPSAFSTNADIWNNWLATEAIPGINSVAVGSIDTGTYNAITVNNTLTVNGGIAGAGVGYMPRSRTIVTATGAGTFTPNAKTRALKVTAQGAGGGAGGVDGQTASDAAVSTGGQGGGYCEKFYTGTIGASYSYSVGVGGAGGAGGVNSGNDGGNTTFTGTGFALSASGGRGTAGVLAAPVSAGGTALPQASTGGDINRHSVPAIRGRCISGFAVVLSKGGDSLFGVGGEAGTLTGGPGDNGVGRGSGGGGAVNQQNATNYKGGDGADGILIIEEYW